MWLWIVKTIMFSSDNVSWTDKSEQRYIVLNPLKVNYVRFFGDINIRRKMFGQRIWQSKHTVSHDTIWLYGDFSVTEKRYGRHLILM